MKRFIVKLSDEGKDTLDRLAKLQHRTSADIVRCALGNYFLDLGINVKVEPGEWGGSRKDSKKGQE